MLNQDFEIVICSRFVICELWSCDMNSTLGSVVPLAMFLSHSHFLRQILLLSIKVRLIKTYDNEEQLKPHSTALSLCVKIYVTKFFWHRTFLENVAVNLYNVSPITWLDLLPPLPELAHRPKPLTEPPPSGTRCLETRHAVCQHFVLATLSTNKYTITLLSLSNCNVKIWGSQLVNINHFVLCKSSRNTQNTTKKYCPPLE